MNLDLRGKNALIGGGSQGLGLASAIELSKLGASCTLVSRKEETLENALLNLDVSKGQTHNYLVADYSKPSEILEKVKAKLEKGYVWHILLLNSGGPASGNILDLSVSDFQQGFDMHFHTSHELSRLLIPGMKAAGYGRIVSVLSISIKQPIAELPVSNAIRSGLASWAKTLANEVGKFNITVNNVLPGYTETDRLEYLFEKRAELASTSVEKIKEVYKEQVPMKRLGKPEEFGAAVAFLCSPAASYINGINLPVDGGATKSL
ncbi:MAG: SDR family oxidoreductase [Cyclobacteriaceae bacterium]|nr:SDR family oxidoreductase [Cyclobacteriaceae bacterium]